MQFKLDEKNWIFYFQEDEGKVIVALLRTNHNDLHVVSGQSFEILLKIKNNESLTDEEAQVIKEFPCLTKVKESAWNFKAFLAHPDVKQIATEDFFEESDEELMAFAEAGTEVPWHKPFYTS